MLTTTIRRPQRWDAPFGADMGAGAIRRLLKISPFSQMNEAAFPQRLPLQGLLAFDTRFVTHRAGDIIIRQGEYGSSAFLLLHGSARIAYEPLPGLEQNATPSRNRGSLWRAVARLWGTSPVREARRQPGINPLEHQQLGVRESGHAPTVFLQDVPRVIRGADTAPLKPGEIFGELGALTRTPRSVTVFAEADCVTLEIRWQGLRDLMRYAPEMKAHVDHHYRQNSLRVHLKETPLLARLTPEQIDEVARRTTFESHGSFDWNEQLGSQGQADPFSRIEREPVVAQEGIAPDGLLLVRSGFGRVSCKRGNGHQTIAYIGKGAVFGAEALAQAYATGETPVLRRSLRAVGYLDVLRIPADVCFDLIAPSMPDNEREALCGRYMASGASGQLPARTLDFLVDHRLLNGTQAMVVDLDRCTRCDDCVRACAATHDGNPRFVRQGPIHERFQYTNACMHCVDPVCMIGCPTGAIHRDAETGVVQINDPTCIGCSTCANSCPYHNIRMVEIRSPEGPILADDSGLPIVKATKCDLCADQPTGPACQHACPHDALVRLDISQAVPLTNFMQT